MKDNNKRITIGLLVSGITDPFSVKLIQGVIREARKYDMNVLVFPGKFLERDLSKWPEITYEYQFTTLYDYVAVAGLDGLIISANSIGCHTTSDRMLQFVNNYTGIPSVLVATHMEGHTCICYDNTQAIKEGLSFLVREQGCRHICLLEGPPTNTDVIQRKNVYVSALKENGLLFEPRMCENGDFETSVVSAQAVETLLQNNPEMDALFCLNDYMAISAYEVLKNHGLRPGEDIKILGYDNVWESGMLDPPLATIGADPIMLGQKALSCLLQILNGEVLEDVKIPSRLLHRKSLGWHHSKDQGPNKTNRITREDFDGIYYRYILTHDTSDVEDWYQKFRDIFQRILDCVSGKKGEDHPQNEETIMEEFDQFISSDLLPFMDTEAMLRLVDRIGSDYEQREAASDYSEFQMISVPVILPEIYRSLVRGEGRNAGYTSLKKQGSDYAKKAFVKETMNFRHGNDFSYSILLGYLGWAGVTDGCLYIYDTPVIHMDRERFTPPESFLMKACLQNGSVSTPVAGNQRRNLEKGLIPEELSDVCRYMMLAPVFFSEELYGLFLCNISEVLYAEGEFIINQLGSAVRMLHLLAANEGIRQQLEEHLTVMRNMNIELNSLSRSDELTGLYNRRGFMDCAGVFLREMQAEQKSCLAGYVDMDNLKVVNDKFGHDEGDYALKAIAEILTKTLSEERCVLGRIGGDEFVFFLAGDEDKAQRVKTALHVAFEEFNQKSSKMFNVSASVGIWVVPADMPVTIEDALSYADTSLYQAKQQKRRNVLKQPLDFLPAGH